MVTAGANFKAWLLMAASAIAGLIALLAPPIPQDPAYHLFADQRTALEIPNFLNVTSNLPIFVVGLWGITQVLLRLPEGGLPELRKNYLVFFIGLSLTGFASGYYHLQPTNASLMWDRLAMVFALMPFFSINIGENISIRIGRSLLWPLLAIGLASVGYWYYSELQGQGDLRPYALVQFLPMLLIPAILLLFRSPFTSQFWIWLILASYGAAKLAELADREIFELFGLFSGHSLKHLLAALAGLAFLLALHLRKLRE